MAKIQVVMAMTLDGFLPDNRDGLIQWVKTDKDGYHKWETEADFILSPGYPLLDLINAIRKKDNSFIYYAGIMNMEGKGFLYGLSLYNLIDEMVIYLLPVTYGKGIPMTGHFQSCQWKLYKSKAFRNGICRLIYHRLRL